MKERGASGYADFRKTPGATGGHAVIQSNKHNMKGKCARGYATFQKTSGAAGGYANFQL